MMKRKENTLILRLKCSLPLSLSLMGTVLEIFVQIEFIFFGYSVCKKYIQNNRQREKERERERVKCKCKCNGLCNLNCMLKP